MKNSIFTNDKIAIYMSLIVLLFMVGTGFTNAQNTDITSTIGTDRLENKENDKLHPIQFSILPFLSTNGRNLNTNNIFSLNLLWGVNGAVSGLELGSLGNSIKREVNGLQAAGLFNTVGGNVRGAQFSGLLNITRGDVIGLQSTGLLNLSKSSKGLQIAGISNITFTSHGLQIAGLANLSKDLGGLQIAGLYNHGKTVKGTQISGLVNLGSEVNGGQVGFINIGRKVKGMQIGFINIVDSLEGGQVGFINIVRKNGYNRFEVAGGETMHLTLGVKFGSKHFYNILQVGGRIAPGAWAVGYGIGTVATINKAWHANIELVGVHLNERLEWTQGLNLTGQFRLTLNYQLARHFNVFIGPTFNVHTSQLYNPDTGKHGSTLMLYNFFDEIYGITNVKMWVGVTGGVRF